MTGRRFCIAEEETGNDGYISCDLEDGHDGLHYDELYKIWWKKEEQE